MNTQTIFITGATDGIGKYTAIELAKQNKKAIILVHGRNKDKLNKVIREIKTHSSNNNIEGFTADLSSLHEVRQLAKDVLIKHNAIDVLVNNAGAGFAAPRYGKDQTETRMTVNYLAPFLLTHLLLTALKKASPSRIVNVSSAGQAAIDFDDIMSLKDFDAVKAYCRSKLALIMFTIDLAEQLKDDNITVNCVHPGTYLDTNMVHEAKIRPVGTAQSGADAEVYLAISPDVENITGKYFNVKSEARAHAQAYDAKARKQLRDLSLKLTGLSKVKKTAVPKNGVKIINDQ